ncbi:MAG: hypothetical protein NTU44_14580 [Bacteroidetes bacterium]|nr:hypothetical protein [Bacteroidota bacterium]
MPHLLVAIPLMDEWDDLPSLLTDLENQRYKHFSVVVCVNQPEEYRNLPEKRRVCENNALTLDLLGNYKGLPISVIDRSSCGKGWTGKKHGVGWARRTAMDECIKGAEDQDVIISLDGDTRFGKDYFLSVAETFSACPRAVAQAVPYYHSLTGDGATDRIMLRYELYMRYYSLNLWRIGSPYSFTALGSAMAVTVRSYKAIGGITPNKSGEDFYFLQKLRKYGELLYWNREKVYPSARFSDRVFFGTGPAMIKGRENDWSSYPFYPTSHFDEVWETMNSFSKLFAERIPTPMDSFLKETFREDDLWQPLRENNPLPERFIRACHEKVDALRILQYMKSRNISGNKNDEENLIQFIQNQYDRLTWPILADKGSFSFSDAAVEELNEMRDFLVAREDELQQQHYLNFNKK